MPIHSHHPITTTIEIIHDQNTLAHLRYLRTPESNLRIPLVTKLPEMPITCHKN